MVSGNEGAGANAQLAYLLYCVSEALRGSDKLDDYDRQYLDVVCTSRLYMGFSNTNERKLKTLLDAVQQH